MANFSAFSVLCLKCFGFFVFFFFFLAVESHTVFTLGNVKGLHDGWGLPGEGGRCTGGGKVVGVASGISGLVMNC